MPLILSLPWELLGSGVGGRRLFLSPVQMTSDMISIEFLL